MEYGLSVIKGSIQQHAQEQGISVAMAFVNAKYIAIVDTSASMSDRDSRGGQERYKVACDELAQLQASHPGDIAVISFSNNAVFCPSGVPDFLNSGTNMAEALRFARQVDDGVVRFFLISDGQPDNAASAIDEASKFKGRIDCIFCGRETDSDARNFLRQIATAGHGKGIITDSRTLELAKGVTYLLKAG